MKEVDGEQRGRAGGWEGQQSNGERLQAALEPRTEQRETRWTSTERDLHLEDLSLTFFSSSLTDGCRSPSRCPSGY